MSSHASEREHEIESDTNVTATPLPEDPVPAPASGLVPLPAHSALPEASSEMSSSSAAPSGSPLERLRPLGASPSSSPRFDPSAERPSGAASSVASASPVPATSLTGDWAEKWGPAIDKYCAAELKTHSKLMTAIPALDGLFRSLATSLRDPNVSSDVSRKILNAIMQAAVNKKAAGQIDAQIKKLEATPETALVNASKVAALRASVPTAFPTFSSNVWIEYINAKALWVRNQGEDRELLPGEKAEESDEGKPDYMTPRDGNGVLENRVLGDHIGVKTGDDPAGVATAVASAILTKVNKYNESQMRVVVDVTKAPARQAMWALGDHGKDEVIRRLNPGLREGSNFRNASIVFSDTEILDIHLADCTPAQPAAKPTRAATGSVSASPQQEEQKAGESESD